MFITSNIDLGRLVEEDMTQVSPDVIRELLTVVINTLMFTEADASCAAE